MADGLDLMVREMEGVLARHRPSSDIRSAREMSLEGMEGKAVAELSMSKTRFIHTAARRRYKFRLLHIPICILTTI